MLHIQRPPSPSSQAQCVPNLLPCSIHHNGLVHASSRYWDPKPGGDGKLEAYFRGRKLKGNQIPVPEGYRGVVVVDGGKKEGLDYQVQEKRRDGLTETEGGSEDDQGKEMKVLKEIATFEEVVVWGHEELVDKDDIFVKGMGEWVQFAEAMHATSNTKPT